MPEEQPQETFIDQLFNLLEQLLIPNWSDLIALLPWVLIGIVLLYVLHTARQWRNAGARNRARVPRRLAGGAPPPGVHMPGPSRWPFVVPIGAALLLLSLALPTRDAAGATTLPFNPMLFGAGVLVSVIAVTGWLIDAMREWRRTEVGGDHGAAHAVALTGGEALALPHGGSALVVAPAAGVARGEFVPPPEPPPGVHMPGPSPWPFFAPIAMTLFLLGLIFSAVLMIGGIVLGIIAAGGWLRDAGREYRSTEALGHAVPETRDPARAWPRRLVPIFTGVIAVCLLVTLAPIGLGYLNNLTPPSAGPTAVAVPAIPEISASTAISFDTGTLVVPCCRSFDLVFDNNHDGVPHNVQILESQGGASLFDGEVIDGVASITYAVPEIPEGDYYFLCRIHPNMNGTLQSRPEGPGGAPPQGPPVAPGAPGSSVQPGPGTSAAP